MYLCIYLSIWVGNSTVPKNIKGLGHISSCYPFSSCCPSFFLAHAQFPRAPPCWVQAQGCNGKDRNARTTRTAGPQGQEAENLFRQTEVGIMVVWVWNGCHSILIIQNHWHGPWPIRLNSRSRLACKALQQKAMAGPWHGAMGGQLDCWT